MVERVKGVSPDGEAFEIEYTDHLRSGDLIEVNGTTYVVTETYVRDIDRVAVADLKPHEGGANAPKTSIRN